MIQTNNVKAASTPARRTPIFSRTHSLLRRFAAVAALLLIGVCGAQSQTTTYVIMYGDNYLTHSTDGGTVYSAATQQFSPTTCFWSVDNSRNIQTANSSGSLISSNKNYLQAAQSGLSLANSGSAWRTATVGQELVSTRSGRFWYTYYYLRLDNNNWSISSSDGNHAILYSTTINTESALTPSISINIVPGLTNGGIQLTPVITGTYAPSCNKATINGATYYWGSDNNASTSRPGQISDWSDATYTWTVTTGAAYASVSSNGLVTITGNPTGNIVVRLTVTKGGFTSNNTQTITLTRASIAQNAVSTTTLTDPSITPVSAGLEYNQSQQFSVSTVTATTNTKNIPAHITLTGGSNTYYYYNGALYASTDDFNSESTTHPDVTYSWALTGHDGKLTPTSGSGSSITVKHSTQATTDANATLTVTASASGESKTATATVKAYSAIADPTITQSGSTIILATTSSDATIYYTTDGSTPTANSNRYSAPFNLTTSPTTIKAIAIRNTTNATSGVATKECSLKLPKPVISISSTGLATIQPGEGSPSDVVIHYTTNNSQPTSSSATYSAPVQLSALQTIMAIAVLEGYENSDIASDDYVNQGVSGGKVIIDDREDHNWTYYSGVDQSVDGGNYNSNYQGKMYSPNPRNVKITYRANGGAVSIDEGDTVFVYYKTLEQGTTTGQYPYTVISNPFSKRPEGKGFGGWKIKEGADYISGYSDEATLSLDADIVFTNLPYTSVNCTSAEIVFEATWVNLNNITYANGNNPTYSVTGGNYETNILVLKRNVTGTITTTSPVTIMMVEPDGSDDYRDDYSFTGNITPNNNGVTKIEFTKWNSSNTLNCNNHSVTVGRGMTTTSQCASYVTGVTGSTSNNNKTTYSSSLNYHLKIESGVFTDVSFIAGTEGTAGYVTCNGTSNKVKGTLGNDYDRAKGDNTKLNVTDELFLGYRPTYASGNQNNASFTCWVKSGNLCSGTNVTNTTFNNSGSPNGGYYGDASQLFYVSVGGAQTYIGKRTVYVEGGILSGIAGGIDSNNGANNESFIVRMTGGQIRGVVYGSGAFAASSGIRRFIVTGGTINGWIAAGCNGTDPSQSGGTLPSDTYVYIGGTAHVGNTTDLTLNTSSDGNVFGAGSGNSAQATTGQVNNSNVVIADECYIKNNVYGGGNYGYSNATATVYVTGGEVAGSVFGGSNQKQGVTVNLNMTGGQVDKGVYGGSNVTGTISQSVTMNINGGQVGTPEVPANIHGGGYGSDTRVTRNVELTLGTTTQTTPGVTVYGDVYGGSALGYVNGTTAADTYHTYVTLNKGTINGSLYGGGLGNNNTEANVYGPVKVTVNGGSVNKTDANGANGSGAVYGCNNINGAPQRAVAVIINGTDPAPSTNEYALFAVYGGGNKANYTYGTPTVTVNNCDNSIEYVYGGGNAAHISNGNTDVKIYGGNKIGNVFGGGNGTVTAANVSGNTSVNIYGGTIGRVFGGSNSAGSIGGTLNVNIEKNSGCAIQVGSVYSGGNKADSNLGTITVGCMDTADKIDSLFCGANQANVTGSVDFTMKGGRINNLFGGNNQSGNVSGSIKVTVDWSQGSCSNNYLGNVFGGGNLATFGTAQNPKAPTVNIYHGTVSGNVYGGGKGLATDHDKGKVTGDPVVTIGDNVDGHQVTISGSVFGGGDAGNVVGTPVVNVAEKCNTVITTAVYGGGNAADVTGTNVTIYGGTIGDVFGGGNGAVAAANVTGATSLTIHGGTITRVFAGGNTAGTIGTNSGVTIDHSSSCDQSIAEVYGGGNLAAGNAGTVTIQCSAENIGDVYGGANQADISNDITLNITGGQINNVFGGNNTSGSISGGITVNINKDASCNTFSVNNVYGGGNLAQYTIPNNKALAVNILNGTVNQNVYGGGKGLASDHTKGQVTGNPVVTIGDANNLNNDNIVATVTGDVYGGGDAGNVVGTPVVNVINKCNTTIGNVYGGGNAADVTGTDVNIDGGTITGMVFGGGHGDKDANPQKQADVNGNVAVDITGGTIAKVFGGSNSKGNITGTVAVNIDKGDNSCDLHIDEVYGGGNQAAGNAGTITIGCTGTSTEGIGDVYGGAREANINSDITLNISGGKINNVFGGNNISGSINGGVEVNINWNGSCDQNSIQNVYGGGNLAQYTIPNGKALAVNILNGTVSQNVYGGGKGDPADHTKGQVTGNPVVTIGDASNLNDDNVQAVVSGDVYGGGDAGNVVGTPQVNVINKCNTSIANVYGGGNAADVSGTDVNIDGGTITGMVFGGGHGDNTSNPQKEANVNGNVTVDITGGTINKVFGGSNSKGNISGTVAVNIAKGDNSCQMHITEVYGGGNEAAGNAGTLTIGCTGDYEINGEGITDVYGGANAANIGNNISLTIRGGHIDRVFGGNNTSGSISGTISVEVNWDNTLTCSKYLGSVFGGGNLAAYTGSPTVTLTNGTVSHSVYGGGNEAGVGGSTVNINGGQVVDGIYGGCNTSGTVTGAIAVNINGGTLGTNSTSMTSGIFGGGYGKLTATEGDVTVTIGDVEGTKTPVIYADIYGGSALGNVNNEATDVTTVNFLNGTLHGNLYGGGLGDASNAAKVNGQVIVNVSNTTQTIAQCKIDLSDATIYGCNNTNGSPQADVTVNIYKTDHNTTNEATYTEDDGTNGNPTYAIDQVFGGGNQADYAPEDGAANSTKKAVVHIYGCDNTIRRVFGGGNAAAATGIQTIIDGGRYDYVFGGGNGETSAANIGAGGTNLQIHGGNINTLFGGSNTSGTISGPMRVSVDATGACGTDMYVDEFFCGNNLAAIGTQANPTSLEATIGCGTRFGDVYGGCNLADIYGNVTLTIEGGTMNNVYGGSKGDLASLGAGHADNAADINGNVELNITGGSIGNAFGGSNINGNITGTIAVNVEKAANPCIWSIGNVYGASNMATYTPTTAGSYPAVNIKNGAITGSVFGGGLGATATVTSNPVVTIGDNTSEDYVVSVGGDVYGGGDAGNVAGTTQVNIVNKCNTTISGDVYGGGNAANVNGTDVNIDGGTITGMVFGGGHGDKDATPDPVAANVNGNVTVDVTGGKIDKVFGGSNSMGNISGTVAVTVNKDANGCSMYIGEVYGGGNEAAGNAGSVTIGNTGTWTTNHNSANATNNRIGYELEGIGTVYGGANAADIGTSQNSSNITLSINNGIVNKVFGGNNSSGDIYGTITVNINRTSNVDNQWHIGNVYGGGNLAAYSHSGTDYPAVNIQNGTVSGSVFGGGLGSTAVVTSNPTVKMTGGQAANVYGGGMQAGVTGNTTVSIEAGTVTTDVYGGGMQADVSGNVTVNISSDTYSGTENVVTIGGDVYGGGALANTNTANRSLNAQNEEVIDLSNTSKKTIVNLYPGATIGHDVYGGGRGQKADNATQTNAVEAVVYGNVTVYQMGAILTAAYSDEGLATGGRIFGGNNINGSPKGHVKVHVSKTTGTTGQQRSSDEARASATATHTYELAAVYGGGNQAEYNPYEDDPDDPEGFAEVEIDGCNDVSIHSVYGGGNAASTPATLVTIGGAYEIEYVFGGGNGAGRNNPGANVGYHDYGNDHAGISQEDVNYRLNSDYKYGTGVAKTNIYGGRIHHIYGGSNTRGNVRETAVAMLDEVNDCPLVVDGIYGGGREAYMEGGTSIELGCITGLDEIYGGSEKADVGSSVALTITSGHFGRVFGGNNKSGKIFGSITVNIEQTGCVPITIDELYLGGNNAPYSVYGYEDSYTEHNVGTEQASETVKHYNLKKSGENPYPDPVLNIRSFKSIGTVYGGGKGEYATMVGDPTVDINVTHGWVNGEYVGTVTELSQYKGAPAQLTEDGVINTVFGGGNAAEVIGSPQVRIGDRMGSTVELSSMSLLYESIDDEPYIEHGDIRITKDGTTGVTYTNKTDGTKTLTEAISQTVNGATITGNVYGGGNAADVTGNTEIQIGPAQ